MSNFRKGIVTIVAGVGMALLGATGARADLLELNPNATNGGAGTLDTTCLSCASYPFFASNSNTGFTSYLRINSQPGDTTSTTASETGSILLLTFSTSPSATTNLTANYNLYATFSINGTGAWGTGLQSGVFTVTSGTAGVTFWGSPNNNTTSGLNFSTPTLGGFGVTAGSGDFNLGTALLEAFLFPPQASGTCGATTGCTTTTAASNLNGIFGFIPAAGTFGSGGFFVNLTGAPFQLAIGAQQGGTFLNTTETVGSNFTDFITTASGSCTGSSFTGTCPNGGGSLTYSVPEPSSVSLMGIALLGLGGLLGWRSRRTRA